MTDSHEPTAKKARISIESNGVIQDRVIIAGKKKFSVNSEALSSKSEYFRVLFQSDFKEKEQKTIELKEISAKSFEQFLLVIERPEDFKATKGKLIDLIATLAYFNCTDPLKIILKDLTNFNKIPKKELLELARTFAVSDITELVEDWYLVRFEDSHLALKYQQLHYAIEYGMNRLENSLLEFFTRYSFYLNDYMDKILNDESELGRKVYQRIKAAVFDRFEIKNRTSKFYDFTSKMNDAQFEDVKDDIEEIVLKSLDGKTHSEIVNGVGWLKKPHDQKLKKVYAFVTEYFIETFPTSDMQLVMISRAQSSHMDEFLAFAIDYYIADFAQTHDWNIIHAAIICNLDPLKVFLKDYLRNNYANLSEDIKKQLDAAYNHVKEFIREATQPEL